MNLFFLEETCLFLSTKRTRFWFLNSVLFVFLQTQVHFHHFFEAVRALCPPSGQYASANVA